MISRTAVTICQELKPSGAGFFFNFRSIVFFTFTNQQLITITFQFMLVLIDKLVRMQLIDCSAVVNWLFSKDVKDNFTKYV